MRFRAKIFLAILIPATLLVAAAVGAAMAKIQARIEAAAVDGLARMQAELKEVLSEQFKQLEAWRKPFKTPRFEAAVTQAADSGDVTSLKDQIRDEFLVLTEPDFYEARGKKDEVLLRHLGDRVFTPGSVYPIQPWMKDDKKGEVLTQVDGQPFLVTKIEPDQGLFLIGRRLTPFLERINKSLGIELALLDGDKIVYSSLPDWGQKLGTGGSVQIAGKRYLYDTWTSPKSELQMVVFLYDVSLLDSARSQALGLGAAAIAVTILIAGLVSSFISRGVSKPVERLVEATRKIASGDYGVQVGVGGRDEIGRLGEAFNEMTIGLRKRQEIMEKTLSRDVAEEFLKGGTERGGERRVITIVFMDIRGYTSGTEGMDPADVVVMLNELMDLLASAIERHGGLVNKFLGDGLMAMFGAPKLLENHALKAVEAGIEMQKQMERWNHRRMARGLPSFYSGIGINTGEVVCGKVGGRSRLEYTLIGEEVNLASRICGKAAPRQVLITKQTRDRLGDRIQVKELEPVVVKGLSYPIKIFEALS